MMNELWLCFLYQEFQVRLKTVLIAGEQISEVHSSLLQY
jgi:hypothetical protein